MAFLPSDRAATGVNRTGTPEGAAAGAAAFRSPARPMFPAAMARSEWRRISLPVVSAVPHTMALALSAGIHPPRPIGSIPEVADAAGGASDEIGASNEAGTEGAEVADDAIDPLVPHNAPFPEARARRDRRHSILSFSPYLAADGAVYAYPDPRAHAHAHAHTSWTAPTLRLPEPVQLPATTADDATNAATAGVRLGRVVVVVVVVGLACRR
ncbi:hypothetical protein CAUPRSCDRAFT_13088 [Caulochytrium protostelioides]|uniref:Uncharacterized protein n=1 Tax=Caulochytrium protostelioides TaxID=1555241 RepID=A0A4P9WQ77_9FUNG|nr:hypothetical protein CAUPRSCDRAFT_13088 [Caulochytrium protostelioides]